MQTLLFYFLLLLLEGDDEGDDSQANDEIGDSGSGTGGIRWVKGGSAVGTVLKKRIVGVFFFFFIINHRPFFVFNELRVARKDHGGK
jgi:hypothetical protein